MSKPVIYLDYNATTPIKDAVMTEILSVMGIVGNPSSVHSAGRQAKSKLEKSRQIIADMVNCRSQMVSFTSGGTEANNTAILCCQLKGQPIKRLIVSAGEHDSMKQSYSRFTGEVIEIPLDQNGLILENEFKEALGDDASDTLVSFIYVNNETGVIQDIAKLCDIAHDAGAIFHTDAVQAFGKIMLDYKAIGVDMMSLSSHKIGGPQGVGVLIAREAMQVSPLISGGGQESGRRSGTENLAGIVGFAKAVSLVPQNLQKMKELQLLRDKLEVRLRSFTAEVKFYGSEAPRVGSVSNILMSGVASETQVMSFDLSGICISAGSACSSGKVKSSHVISAMGANETDAGSTIRLSMGWKTTALDTEKFYQTWVKLYSRKKAQ